MKKNMRSKHKRSGQSLVEFFLTILAFFTVAFMFVQVAIGFGLANYVQYATFLSARAYLSGQHDQEAQRRAAAEVITRMLGGNEKDRFKNLIKPSDEGDPKGAFIGAEHFVPAGSEDARIRNWQEGVRYKFKARIYMLPILRSTTFSSQGNSIELESETWLGREPSAQDCINYLTTKKGPSGSLRSQVPGAFLYDNGC